MNDDELRSAFADLLSDLPDDGPLPVATARRAVRRRGLKSAALGAGGAASVAAVVALVLSSSSPTSERLVPAAPLPPATASPSAAPSPSATPSPSTTGAPVPSRAPSRTPVPGTTAGPTRVPSTPAPPPSPSSPASDARLVLRPDGLGVSSGSSTSALPFGTSAAAVGAVVDRLLGAGTESPNPDCGAGTSGVQHPTLSLVLRGGVFVGWVSTRPGLTTADGLAVGSTLAQLRDALPDVQLSSGTLGQEWSTVEGGLAGFLDGTGTGRTVSGIAAGARCLAR